MDVPSEAVNSTVAGSKAWRIAYVSSDPAGRRGVVIVATDYQGLGGPGKHNYAQPISNGTDVINALRAARDFKPAAAGEQAVVYGWSQGGGSTLGAASLKDYLQRGMEQHR
ncbi:MAG: lipase family protein [Cyanobacteriota bacterium]|nr:lipase family protein [Cyanobacteriota bacterium]